MLEDSPLHRAIVRWIEINGVQPPDENGRWSGTMGNYEIKRQYDDLKEAMELDPSDTTAVLMMRKFMAEYASGITTSATQMMADPSAFLAKIEAIREINALLDIVEVNEDEAEFITALRTQIDHFGAGERADVQKLLSDRHQMARLRRDALRSLDSRLRMDQFLIGDHEPDDVKPIYVPIVHQYWNINSLLATMANTPSGVSLTLIRDQADGFESYFAFVIRNGGNIITLTDIAKYAHPLGAQMKRKPGRDFEERATRNWFPYELMDIEVTEEGDLILPQRSDVTALVAHQNVSLPMKPLKDLQAPDLIWITLMFDLIISKYWIRKEQAAQLSYTGEMLKVNDALAWQAKMANLPVAQDIALLELSPLTIDDISNPDLDESQIGYIGPRPNQWLEDRYRDQVSPEVLNVVGEAREDLLLMADGSLVDRKAIGVRPLGRDDAHGWSWDEAKKKGVVQRVEQYVATRFGTVETIEADRRWLARYNFATRINQLAKDEYDREKDEVRKLYFDAVRANIDNIMTWVTGENMYAFGQEINAPEINRGYRHVGDRRAYLFQKWIDRSEPRDSYDYSIWNGEDIFLPKYRKDSRDFSAYCCVTGAKASYTVRFDPCTPEMIAAVMGCTFDELPLWLQNFKSNPYMKNSILNRVDPVAFVVHNPWERFDPSFRLHFSKRGLKAILTRHTDPPLEISNKESLEGSSVTIRIC